jgi:hypothetical protein
MPRRTISSEHPELLDRLYRPFYRHHQEYQAADAGKNNWYPIFGTEPDGGLRIRFNARVIRRGYAKTGRVLDDEGVRAVDIMDAFLGDPAHRHDFFMEPGQMQILNNRFIVTAAPLRRLRRAGEAAPPAAPVAQGGGPAPVPRLTGRRVGKGPPDHSGGPFLM